MKMRQHRKRQAARWTGCPAYLHQPAWARECSRAAWHFSRAVDPLARAMLGAVEAMRGIGGGHGPR